MDTVKFNGQECVTLQNGSLRLLIAQSMGPRVMWLSFVNGENIFAELPDFMTAAFHFYGGHRLWHAPEDINRTYEPDDAPVHIAEVEGGLQVTQDVESKSGLEKTMDVRLDGEAARVVVTHTFKNHNVWPVTCAPWAITQLKNGGVAILPQSTAEAGLLPNRSLAMWQYTDPSDPHVTWGKAYVMVEADVAAPFKVGFPNPRGWLAYWWNGMLFVKRAAYQPGAAYYDFGSSSEFYCSDRFAELETLGPIASLAPGGSIAHTETWELHSNIERPRNEAEAQAIVEKLGLG